jgi:integrase
MATIRELIKKDGSRSYHVEVRLKGHPPQRATFRTRSLAKKWVQDVESGIRDGRHFKIAESKSHTVGELIDRFVRQWLSIYPDSQKKQAALLNWWNQWCGHLLLGDLTPAVIAEGRDYLLSESTVRGGLRNPSTVNRYLSALGKALTVAVKEWGWLEDSPIRNVSKPSESEGRERFLSFDEKNQLLLACRESRNSNLLPIVSLALITGMRFGEIVGLCWRDIDFKQRTITLLRTKNGDRRVIPLTDEAANIFRECPTFGALSDELVFKSLRNTNTQRKVSIREAFEHAVRRAGIKNFRFHDLRHTAASYMAMAGATQGELMAILGHRSPSMTRRYAHYSQAHLSKVLERSLLAITNKDPKEEQKNDATQS